MNSLRITYAERSDATPEVELGVLAAVFRLVLDCHAKKEATHRGSPDDARKDQDAGTYTHCT